MDKPPLSHEVGKTWLKKPCFGIAAIAACGVAGSAAMLLPAGEHKVYKPQKIELTDNEYAMATWNMQGKTTRKRKALKRLIARHSLDGIALQEVYGDDIAPLRRAFKAWTIIDSPADKTRHRTRGGYHNVLMVQGSVNEVKSSKISRAGPFEQRSVVITEMPAVFGVDSYDVVLGTTHVGRQKRLNREQFPEAVEFIDTHTKDDASVIVCGDFNRGTNTTQRYFGERWSIAHTGNTTPSGHKVDFCLSQDKGSVTITEGFVDKTEKTDHYPVIVKFAPTRIDIAGHIVDYLTTARGDLAKYARQYLPNVQE